MKVYKLGLVILFMFVFFVISFGVHNYPEKKDLEKYFQSLPINESSVEELCNAAMNSDDETVKILAIRRLGDMFEKGAKNAISERVYKKAIETLIAGLEEGNDRIVRIGSRQVNPFWEVRSSAADALAKVKDPSTVPNLIKALRYDQDPIVKRSVALGLGKMKAKEAVPALIDVLETTPDQGLAGDIVKALGEIGDKKAFGALIKVIRGNFMPKVKEMAQESLEKIQWVEEPEEVIR
ncbi:MAG: HEAT repeat domain-containing protein [Brevinematia bacterium]